MTQNVGDETGPGAENEAASREAARFPNNDNEAILFCEDDPEDRHLFQKAFERLDAAPSIEFVDGAEALFGYLNDDNEFTGGPAPRFIVLDLNMPVFDGRRALVRMKRTARLKTLPVVILSTSGARLDIERCYEFGAYCYIQKPFDLTGAIDIAETLTGFWHAGTIENAHIPKLQSREVEML